MLGILGATGGVGVSSLATACAVRAASAGRQVALVDAHPWAGGLEVVAGLEAAPGLRWADLAGVRGDVDPDRLLEELPVGEEGFRCLSWGSRPPIGDVPVPLPMLATVRQASPLVIVDLPRPASERSHQDWWGACDELVLVVEASITGLGAAIVLAQDCSPTGVVLRTPTVLPEEEISSVVGAPLLAGLPQDRTVARCLEHGEPVGSQSGPLAEAADLVLSRLLPGLRAA